MAKEPEKKDVKETPETKMTKGGKYVVATGTIETGVGKEKKTLNVGDTIEVGEDEVGALLASGRIMTKEDYMKAGKGMPADVAKLQDELTAARKEAQEATARADAAEEELEKLKAQRGL